MRYELLNRKDIIRQDDEWYDESDDYGAGRWNPCEERWFGQEIDSNINYRRPIQTWQPISTAPKDGTAMLAGWECRHSGWRTAVVYWDRPYNPESKFDWCLEHTGAHAISSHVDGEPSHWQPLPDAPEREEKV